MLVALSLMMILPFAVTACFALPPADTSYEEKIPAALEGAGLGLSGVSASRSTDGTAVVLNVSGTSENDEVTAVDLRQILDLVRANNTLGGDRLDLAVRNTDDSDFIDLDGPAQALGAPAQVSASDGPLPVALTWDVVDEMVDSKTR